MYNNNIPDEAYIYWIDVHSSSLVKINCDQIKQKKQVQRKIVNNKVEVSKVYGYIKNSDKLIINEALKNQKLDSRVLIEFRLNGKIIDEICWSYSYLEKDNIIYSCDIGVCEVEEFLYNNRIINRYY